LEKAGGNILGYVIQKLENFVLSKDELLQQWNKSIVLPIYKKGGTTDYSNCRVDHFYQLHTKFYPISCLKVNASCV
jgi:hypothetical protein